MYRIFAVIAIAVFSSAAFAEVDEQCLKREVAQAANFTTVAELRRLCTFAQEEGIEFSADSLEDAQPDDKRPVRRLILSHRPNYFVMSYYDNPNNEPFGLTGEDRLQRFEAKFQLSFKIPVYALSDTTKVYFAYTGRSWWQIGDRDRSRPFRETNHQPEAFVEWRANPQYYRWLDDLDAFNLRFGVAHESNGQVTDQINGQAVELSRSWNRIYAEFQIKDHSVFREGDQFYLSFQPWIRLQESEKEEAGDPTGDDNPNIENFAGQAEIVAAWRRSNDSADSFSVRLRNNFRSDNRGLIELGWGRRVNKYVEIYTQFTSGYAESLIDYDEHSNRIAVGARLTDWF